MATAFSDSLDDDQNENMMAPKDKHINGTKRKQNAKTHKTLLKTVSVEFLNGPYT
jgi:hypothetical protein